MPQPRIDFFLIGAARSGTTSMYRLFQRHPRFFVPHVKEPRFFTENMQKGWDWYASLYADAPDDMICGDLSPNYSNADSNVIAKRIHSAYPDAKILYIVRNPIECAISNWRMRAENAGKIVPFEQALDRWRKAVFIRVKFFQQVSYFREFYPDSQIKVMALEQLRREPEKRIELFQFLGVEPISIQFPHANRSDRKPDRPGIPRIPIPVRERFIELVADDARELLNYIGAPPSLWNLSVTNPAFMPVPGLDSAKKRRKRGVPQDKKWKALARGKQSTDPVASAVGGKARSRAAPVHERPDDRLDPGPASND